jgi:hypothetical protein
MYNLKNSTKKERLHILRHSQQKLGFEVMLESESDICTALIAIPSPIGTLHRVCFPDSKIPFGGGVIPIDPCLTLISKMTGSNRPSSRHDERGQATTPEENLIHT